MVIGVMMTEFCESSDFSWSTCDINVLIEGVKARWGGDFVVDEEFRDELRRRVNALKAERDEAMKALRESTEWAEQGEGYAADVRWRLATAEARVAELERRLRDAPFGGGGSHWDGCWRSHIDCAGIRVADLERRLSAALVSLADSEARRIISVQIDERKD